MQIGISDLSRTVTATELSKSAFSQANTIMNFNGSNPFFGHIPGPPNGCHRVYQGMSSLNQNAMPNRAPPPYFFRQSSLPNDPAPMHHWGGGHGIMRLSRQWSSGYESHHRGLIPLGHHGHPSSHGFGRHGRFFHPYHVPTRLPNPIRNFAPGGYPRLSGNDNLQRFFNPIDRNVPGGFPAPTRHNLPSRFSNTNGHYGPIRSNHFSNHRGSSTTTRNNLSNEVHAQNEISNRQNAHITQRVGIDHRSRSFIPWKDQLGGKHQKRSSKESKLDASVEPAFLEEAPPKETPKYVEPRDEEFEKSLLEYANREFFNPESLFNNFEVSGHSLYLDQPMNYEEESVTAQLDDDTLRNVGAPAFNYGYGGFPIPSLPENEDIEYHEEETKWIRKRDIEKKQKLTEYKKILMGTVDRLQMEVNKKRSEIEEIIENTEKQTRDDARLLERKSIYFFVEETDAQKKDRKWRSKFLSHFGNVKDLPLDQLMVRLKNALREKKQLQKRRESKEIIKKVEEDIRVAEKFLGRASTYFIAEQELERASREMRSIIQFDNKLKRRLNERDTLWKEIMEKNCVKTTLNHQFTDVLNMEKDTEQWRPSKVVSIPWIFRLAKSSSTAHYQLTVDFKPLVPVASGFIATVRPTIGTKKLSISKFEYFGDKGNSATVFEMTFREEEIEKYLDDGHLFVKLKVCVKSGNDLRERLEFNKSEDRDTCVIVEDQRFYVSKRELASFSPVFDRMFFGGFVESKKSEITSKGIFASDFHDFLVFCVNGGRLENDTVRGIADIAEMYDIEAVRLCASTSFHRIKQLCPPTMICSKF
ncbi:Protein CBG10642 [Caenorhabditis briggsae]|uniref:Protein CBG10642 n=1 Tax=Caenorhabditis briggsae TaxID=6238 RepID=A8XBI2_CAEBR|nr:Protein CBG10642 [Caenorhabditis briggsae]CAP29997.2 Protein CBG10642 [Caenorhabditis briggsae]